MKYILSIGSIIVGIAFIYYGLSGLKKKEYDLSEYFIIVKKEEKKISYWILVALSIIFGSIWVFGGIWLLFFT